MHYLIIAYLRHARYRHYFTSHKNGWLPLSNAYGITMQNFRNLNKFDFTYTADNKKLKIDYKINSVSAELDENGNLKVISGDATIVFFIEQSGDNTISGYYQYSLVEGAKRYPYNAVKLK